MGLLQRAIETYDANTALIGGTGMSRLRRSATF